MGIKHWVAKQGGKAANKIAKLSALSPEQVIQIQERRDQYFTELQSKNPNDTAAHELTNNLLAASSIEVFNAYLPQLSRLYVPIQRAVEYDGRKFETGYNIRYFNITKWVTDKDENSLEKLINVYDVLSNENCNIALIFHRSLQGTAVYLAVTNTDNDDSNSRVNDYKTRLADAIRGNFPGTEWKDEKGVGVPPCLKSPYAYSVASASNIPTEKSEKFISQTIEKLLDGIVPQKKEEEYTLILLATPMQDVEERKLRLGELYSGLAPYASWQTGFTYTETDAIGSTANFGVNVGASAGVQNGQNQAITNSHGTTDSSSEAQTDTEGRTESDSNSRSETDSSSNTETQSTNTSVTDTTGTSTNSSTTHTEGSNETASIAKGINASVNSSVNASATTSASVTASAAPMGVGGSATVGESVTVGGSVGSSLGTSRTTTEAIGSSTSDAITKGITESASKALTTGTGQSTAETVGKAVATTMGKTVAKNTAQAITNTLGKAITNTVAQTAGTFKSVNLGGNFGVNFARSSNVTATMGKNESITQSFTNFNIKHALEVLEEQMKRYEQSTALGMWDFAAYVLSEDMNIANNVAHSYVALTQGEKSYMSHASINLWRGDMGDDSRQAKEICDYLRELRHPLFGLRMDITEADPTYNVYPLTVTATTGLSGKELAYSLNFPRKSVTGFPVFECAEFGRNIVTYDSVHEDTTIQLGQIFHMHHTESTEVALSKRSLTSHVFIAGSTGSGKSNTVYQILEQARENSVHFLVIEPAKGEYKQVFGMDEDVSVYGTNPYITPLLRINPFSFSKGIHVLEHLDRLIEIFNVCWPMYAAMPAVLKSAVEKSYVDCGWDLIRSKNAYDEELYPTFKDVARNIKTIIDSSEYDSENKGAYKGSLLTRLQSLSNGINGMIFTTDEIPMTKLFDENVIIDLSRVGSSETKSLIMGMLVLKLQEYRMTQGEMNADLKHITVLEEAHNLLKRTSTEQPVDGGNLQGKSVEMIANAIAEMRTYGEGFIIADQAPGLLDMATIRNTNTKIILRLPDQNDRELVGRAANLNENQIAELAKLPCGVAATYQNEWIQPVLCKVAKHSAQQTGYTYTPEQNDEHLDAEAGIVSESLLDCIMNKELLRKGNCGDMLRLKQMVIRSKLDTSIKKDFMEYISSDDTEAIEALRQLLYNFLSAKDAIKAAEHCNEITTWVHSVVDGLNPSIKNYSKEQIDLALALILHEQVIRDATYNDLLVRFVEIYKAKGGVF